MAVPYLAKVFRFGLIKSPGKRVFIWVFRLCIPENFMADVEDG